jgi:hypothetical protein
MKINKLTSEALQKLKAEGKSTGTVPFGYSKEGNNMLVENSREMLVITTVRELRNAGMTFRGIIIELTNLGLLSRKNKAFSMQSVFNMLR